MRLLACKQSTDSSLMESTTAYYDSWRGTSIRCAHGARGRLRKRRVDGTTGIGGAFGR
jgi:hypothetical protein